MSGVVEKAFQRHEPLAEAHPDPEAQAGLVRAAQDPGAVPMERVGPERCFAPVQFDAGRPDRQCRALPVFDGMDRRQRRAQLSGIDPPFRPPPLEPRLRFGHAVLHGFDRVAARERAP